MTLKNDNKQLVKLRKFPFPYKSCLSICSDIDNTVTNENFKIIQSFIRETIGIQYTESFFPFHEKEFCLFSNNINDRAVILEHINNGNIEALHSFGEKIDLDRQDALKTIDLLNSNKCSLKIWIDHAQSKSNFCKYRFNGKGDIPSAKEYHADITRNYGVKFIWTEDLINIVGQDVSLTLNSVFQIYDNEYPFYSLLNISKTFYKIILSFFGYEKYKYFKNNDLVRITTLHDKQKIYKFIRFNNYYKRPIGRLSFTELHYLISPGILERLKKVEGYSIVYIHMGSKFDIESVEGKKTVAALYNLKKEFNEGNIYVETTLKILNYYIIHKYLNWDYKIKNDEINISISSVDDPVFGSYIPDEKQLRNITFYIPENKKIRIFIKDLELKNLRYNAVDYSNRISITIN